MKAKYSYKQQKYIILIIVGLFYSFGIAYFFQSLPSAKFTSDFFPRWHASRMLLTTNRSIYDWTNAEEVSAVTGWPYLNQLGYYYPAYMLLFTAPLSLLPYGVAHLIWTVFGLWCLWLGIVIFAHLPGFDISTNRLTVFLILVTTSVPVFQHTLYAQFNSIGVLALALSYQAMSRKRYLLAGVWAGGLLFKPQAALIIIAVMLMWTVLTKNRWLFWVGLALISVGLWLFAEILERNWVVNMFQSLGEYVPVSSILDKIWNPYQTVSLILAGVTFWLIFRLRNSPADSIQIQGLLVWAINLNALIIPLFGMQHMVFMGVSLIILLRGFTAIYPLWIWPGVVGLLVVGLASFVIPMFLVGSTGLQITISEMVYRFAMPLIFSVAALLLMLKKQPDFIDTRTVF